MVRRFIVVLVALLLASPVSAQDLRSSFQRAATQAAAEETPQEDREKSRGLLWTGVSLLGGGGMYFWLGEGYSRIECTRPDSEDCRAAKFFKTFGAVVAGAGGALLAIYAGRSRDIVPRVSLTRRGFAIEQPVPLHRLSLRRAAR